MKKYKNWPYRPLSSDIIEKKGYPWVNIDTLYRLNGIKKGIIFLNTDVKTGRGIHWILLVISPVKTETENGKSSKLLYYDPLGRPVENHPEIIEWCRKNNKKIFRFKFQTQYLDSWSCGFHCLYVADLLKPYVINNDILSFKKFIKIIHDEIGGRPSYETNQKILKYSIENELL